MIEAVTTPETPQLHVINGGADTNGAEEQRRPLKIRWTKEEMRAVANATAEGLRKQRLRHVPQVGDRVGRELLADIFALAQHDTLPRERRRLGVPLANVSDEFWQFVEIQLTSGSDTQKTDTVTSAGAPPTENKPTSETCSVVAPAPKPDDGRDFAMLFGDALSAFLNEARAASHASQQQIEMLIEDQAKLRAELKTAYSQIADLHTKIDALASEKKQLPRVAIVGCQKYEFDRICSEIEAVGIKLDFRLYEQDTNPTTIYADYCIGLRWMSHAWMEQIKARVPKGQFMWFDGGCNKAIEQLKTWFKK